MYEMLPLITTTQAKDDNLMLELNDRVKKVHTHEEYALADHSHSEITELQTKITQLEAVLYNHYQALKRLCEEHNMIDVTPS